MNVHEYKVPEKVIEAALAAMVGEFTASTIEEAAIAAGAPKMVKPKWAWEPCAYRIADRLLQRQRKAGKIKFAKGVWSVVAVAA